MNFARLLQRRMILGALLSTALVAVIIAAPIVRFVTASLVHRQLELMDRFGADAVAACEADPAAWRPGGPGWTAWAYDEAFVPAAVDAPPVSAWMELEASLAGRAIRISTDAGRVVRPLAGHGPCAWMTYRWEAGPGILAQFAVQAGLLFAASVLLVGAGGSVWVVRPITDSVDAVRAAAARVGAATFLRPPVHPVFHQLAEVLAQAHQRVAEEQSAILRAQGMLEQHLDVVAHDLRTPLASLTLRLEALADEAPGDARLEAALGDVTYLSQLVGNLHQATRLQRASRRQMSADLGELLARVAARFAVLGRRAGVSVSSNVPSHAIRSLCDPDAVEQALANLVANAIEHAEAGNVAVTLDARGGRFALRVLDDGHASPPGALPALQEAVARQRSVTSREAHTGLGLAIVGTVVDRHGWTIAFSTVDPHGIEVCIEGACDG